MLGCRSREAHEAREAVPGGAVRNNGAMQRPCGVIHSESPYISPGGPFFSRSLPRPGSDKNVILLIKCCDKLSRHVSMPTRGGAPRCVHLLPRAAAPPAELPSRNTLRSNFRTPPRNSL